MNVLLFLIHLALNFLIVFLFFKWREKRDLPKIIHEANRLAQHFSEKSWFVNNTIKAGALTSIFLSAGSCNHVLNVFPSHPDAKKASELSLMDVVEFEYRKPTPRLSRHVCDYLRITKVWSRN